MWVCWLLVSDNCCDRLKFALIPKLVQDNVLKEGGLRLGHMLGTQNKN